MGDGGAPVVGYSAHMMKDPHEFFQARYDRFGEVSWLGAFGRRCALVFGPDGTERVLGNKDKEFSAERGWGYLSGPFFTRGILFLDGAEHLLHRRIMQEAFTRSRMTEYMMDMGPGIARRVAAWEPAPEFPVYTRANDMTLDLSREIFVGAGPGREGDALSKAFVDCLSGVQAVIRADVPGGAWHRGVRARKTLEEYFYQQLPAKRSGDGKDLFSVLSRAESEHGERFTDEDVVNHMIFFQLAAHETTTISIAMFAYYLAKYPEWQERLRVEAARLGKAHLEFDDFDALPSFELAFKETLRMNSPVGLAIREAITDTDINGYFVPAGTMVIVSLFSTHRIARWWNNPDTFDPERYNSERREDKRHKYIWAPFGGSAHKCIGMHFGGLEVKAALYHMLLRFSWTVPAGYEPHMIHRTGPLPADGLPINLQLL
jgi:cytochrome P450